jgi:hypothetical protein
MDQRYLVKSVRSDEEAQQWLNHAAAQGYRFVSMTTSMIPFGNSEPPTALKFITLVVEKAE